MNRYRSPYVTCHGPSMFPVLSDGDGLILSPCAGPEDLAIGDIIVYPHPFEPCDVAHRVVAISAGGVITRGDANEEPDPEIVPWARIRGRVVDVIKATRIFVPTESEARSRAYVKPGLFPLSDFAQAALACMNGHEASGNACVSGPEASGGCKSGAAASTQCLDGAAAGIRCKAGTGN